MTGSAVCITVVRDVAYIKASINARKRKEILYVPRHSKGRLPAPLTECSEVGLSAKYINSKNIRLKFLR